MKLSLCRYGFVLILFALCQYSIGARALGSRSQSSEEAYVTLLYGDEFLLGVRVLGKSIRDTGSTKDMVVLVSDGVSGYAKKLLKADGWIVELISLLANPNQVRPERFWGVYTKLKIFNMTNYKKVVYLDADTIVVKSVEDLFKCGKFCANLKHSERLNSGVMVVEPSAAIFNDMMSKVTTLPSYTGGDQGFLNSYYVGFASAHVFDPNLSPEVLHSRPSPEMERLSTLYNADVGLYMLANKWMVDEKELRVIHYTLGPLKPWDWWTSWLLKPVDVWQNVRKQLQESLPGTGQGRNPKDNLLVKFLFLFPLFALLLCYHRSFLQSRSFLDHTRHLYNNFRSRGSLAYSAISSAVNSNQQFSNGALSKVPAFLPGTSVFVCFMATVVSLAIALSVVPHQVMPWTGLLLMYEWTFTIFFLLFGGYLHLIYKWGKRSTNQAGSFSSRHEGQQRQMACDFSTWNYWLGMAFLAVVAPSLPCVFGITALFPRLGLMVVGGLILASFMTYASEHLAITSFLRGLEDRDTPRTRSICFLC
ncbi:inositol phosphorylceramide glucuronosyltransferase 1 [Cornus florida]|uniref:inositol phosphorylceramide glucuronosyltransferase 1 n=1 Tax=Cornus florida TaxID=4283 RepID=UPI00289FB8EE|nr:inositol phosphorylceramide glucuronosyltransferase 1 [Cornus florida]